MNKETKQITDPVGDTEKRERKQGAREDGVTVNAPEPPPEPKRVKQDEG